MPTQYGADAQITGSLEVDGDIVLGSGDDDINLDSNTLSIDADNNRVGIGTATPGEKLHVAGNLKVAGDDARIKIDGDTDSHPGLELYENGTRKWIVYNNYTNDNFTFKTNSNIRMVIEQDGNVGIGTNDPATTLDVDGNTTLGGGLVYGSETLTNSNNGGSVATGTPFSMVTSAAGATAVTLGNASIDGQTKIIVCTGHGGSMNHFGVNVTAASWAGGAGAISFTAAGTFVRLIWGNSSWWVIGSSDSGVIFT